MEKILINAPEFDAVTAYGIGGLAVLMAAISVIVYSQGNRRRLRILITGSFLWLGVTAIAALSGLLSKLDAFPPPFVVMMVSMLAVAFAMGFSSFGKSVAANTSFFVLIALQSFRLPLEFVMHHAFEKKIMPIQLSYSGYNFDVITGLGAVILLILLKLKPQAPKSIIWIWNVWGIYCLIVIAVVAVAGSPIVHGFGGEPENLNTWVLFFPYVWLPTVLVVLAIFGHIIITRKLLQDSSRENSRSQDEAQFS